MTIEEEGIKKQNLDQPEVPDHPYQILINGGSGSGKTNPLLKLIIHEPDFDIIYVHAKDRSEAKYQLLIKKKNRKYRLKVLKSFKSFY